MFSYNLRCFPAVRREAARQAVEGAARNPQFTVDLDQCLYSASYEGTQVLIAGELGFDALAKELSRLAQNPVMLLLPLRRGLLGADDFYGGREEDHFSTMPDYFSSHLPGRERAAGRESKRPWWAGSPPGIRRSCPGICFFGRIMRRNWRRALPAPGTVPPMGTAGRPPTLPPGWGFPGHLTRPWRRRESPSPLLYPPLGEILEQGIPPHEPGGGGAFGAVTT